MKEFLDQKGPYIHYQKDKTFYYIMEILIFIFLYRIITKGFIPYTKQETTLKEISLFILVSLASLLLCYGFFKLGEHFISKQEYQEQECLIDGLLLALLVPSYTSITLLLFMTFMTIMIGRYFYHGSPIFVPVLVGIVSSIGFSIWMNICHFTKYPMFISILEQPNLSHTEMITHVLFYSFIFFSLTIKKSLKWRIPVYFIGSSFLLLTISMLFSSIFVNNVFTWLLDEKILLLLIFVAPNQRTTPITKSGQILFATLLAIFTYFYSYFFPPFLVFSLAILSCNLFVPLLDYFGNYYQLRYCSEYQVCFPSKKKLSFHKFFQKTIDE